MTNDAELVESAKERTGLSTGDLAEAVAVDDRRLRRVLSGELPLPDSARLLVQLVAARPDLVPVLARIRAGVPDQDPDEGLPGNHCEICAPQEDRLQGYRCTAHRIRQ